MTTYTTIALDKLVESPDNAGRTGREEGILSLAANIRALGILVPLIVRSTETGDYEVLDGHRRLMALRTLRDNSVDFAPDTAIPCVAVDAQDGAGLEVSLAANTLREALHPADEAESFAKLDSIGIRVEEIANHFGTTVRHVKQRLAIANVIPEIMQAYRAGTITLDVVKAFASGGPDAQRKIWENNDDQVFADWEVRNAMTSLSMHSSSGLVQFVGEEAYLAAGGRIDEDLFFDVGYFFDDPELLRKLAKEKAESLKTQLLSAGWSWVEIADQMPGLRLWTRLIPSAFASEEDAKRFAELGEIEEGGDDVMTSCQQDELDDIEGRMVHSDDQKAMSGVIIDFAASPVVNYGYVRPGPIEQPKSPRANAETEGATEAPRKPEARGYPASLIFELECALTEATQMALLDDRSLALAVLVAAVSRTNVSGDPIVIDVMGAHAPNAVLAKKRLAAGLPKLAGDYSKALAKALAMSDDDKMAVLVNFAARSLRLTRASDPLVRHVKPQINPMIWRPDHAFFTQLTKTQIIEALSESGNKDIARGLEGASKPDMVTAAAKAMNKSDWLPEALRVKGRRK